MNNMQPPAQVGMQEGNTYPGYYCIYPTFVNNWQSSYVGPPQPFQEKIDFEKTRQGLRKTKGESREKTLKDDQKSNEMEEDSMFSENENVVSVVEEGKYPSCTVQSMVNVPTTQSCHFQQWNHGDKPLICPGGSDACQWIEDILLSESLDKSLDVDLDDLMMDV